MKIGPIKTFDFISCNIPALDYEAWDSNIAYPVESKVSVEADEKNYYATKAIEAGVAPDPTDKKGKKTGWYPEPNKRSKMINFDGTYKTENADSIDFSFRALNIDTLHFGRVDAKELYIKITDYETGFLFYEKTIPMEKNRVHPYNFFFVPPTLKTKLTERLEDSIHANKIEDLVDTLTETQIVQRYTTTPALFFDVKVEISIKKPGGVAKIGEFVSTTMLDMGFTLWENSNIRVKKYGLMEQDPWGNWKLKQGSITDIVTMDVIIPTSEISGTKDILNESSYGYNLIIGDESQNIPNLTLVGVISDESISPSPNKTIYTLKIGSVPYDK